MLVLSCWICRQGSPTSLLFLRSFPSSSKGNESNSTESLRLLPGNNESHKNCHGLSLLLQDRSSSRVRYYRAVYFTGSLEIKNKVGRAQQPGGQEKGTSLLTQIIFAAAAMVGDRQSTWSSWPNSSGPKSWITSAGPAHGLDQALRHAGCSTCGAHSRAHAACDIHSGWSRICTTFSMGPGAAMGEVMCGSVLGSVCRANLACTMHGLWFYSETQPTWQYLAHGLYVWRPLNRATPSRKFVKLIMKSSL